MKDKKCSVYVHKVDTDNGPLYYTGVTTMKLWERWRPGVYKGTSLWPYIEMYGWENIEHVVIFETEDHDKALKTEDMLICGYAALGRCINKQRSGYIWATDKNEYKRQYQRERRANDHEWAEQQRKWRRDKLANDPEYAERARERTREWFATTAGRIYDRVHGFNRYHPDLAVETPKEARDKYLATGYIPQYIKHDDL